MSEVSTTERFVTHCHLKRPCPPKTNAFEKTLCDRADPGIYVYMTLTRGEQIPETHFPVCTPCAARHVEEHYAAVTSPGEDEGAGREEAGCAN